MLTRKEKNEVRRMVRHGATLNGKLLEAAKQVEWKRIEKYSEIIKEKTERREVWLKTLQGQNDDSLNYVKSVRALNAGIKASERRLKKLEEIAEL